MPNKIRAKTGLFVLVLLLAAALVWAPFALAKPKKDKDPVDIPAGNDSSDVNKDAVVNLADLQIFSAMYLELNPETVDWCAFYVATAQGQRFSNKSTDYYFRHFGILLGFVNDYFGCNQGPLMLTLKNEPTALTRVAVDSLNTGNLYISDARVGSVFIYDSFYNRIGEIQNLDKPLGVAIDTQGYLLVGNNGRDNIEIYDPANGDLLGTFGEGQVRMPTAISIGPDGEIYVTDSKANRVWVYDSFYVPSHSIGTPGSNDGQLKFPSDTAVVLYDAGAGPVEEVFVTDQANKRIQVFDRQGNFQRTIPPLLVPSNWCVKYGFGCPENARGMFINLQALDVDAAGRVHILDIYEAAVTIYDPVTGEIAGSYGGWGETEGLLRAPIDVKLTDWGEAVVTDNRSSEMEVFAVP